MQQALLTPVLAARASRVLGLLGSPTAQESLVEFAQYRRCSRWPIARQPPRPCAWR